MIHLVYYIIRNYGEKMNSAQIIERSKQFSRDFRNQDQKRNDEMKRMQCDYPCLIYFFGDDMSECRSTIEGTTEGLWLNADEVHCFEYSVSEIESGTAVSKLEDFADEANINRMDGLRVIFVMRSEDNISSHIGEFVDTIIKNAPPMLRTKINFSLFTIAKSIKVKSIQNLETHLEAIDSFIESLEPSRRDSITSYILGDMYDERNETIEDEYVIYDAIATTIISENNALAYATHSHLISLGKHNLVGFSKADVSLETLYIIGFDEFSDMLVKKFRVGERSDVQAPEYNFSVRNDIISSYATKIASIKSSLMSASSYLWKNPAMPKAPMGFAAYNEQFGNVLEDYVSINLNKEEPSAPTEEEIEQMFNEHLIKYFNENGLEKAKKYVEEIDRNEHKRSNESQDLIRQYDYKNNQYTAEGIAKCISDISEYKLIECEIIARQTILKMLADGNHAINKLDEIFKNVESSTEACKQERVVLDKNVNDSIRQHYESLIVSHRNDILNMYNNKTFAISFDSQEAYDKSVFDAYEKHVALTYLFNIANIRSYFDNIQNSVEADMESSKGWVSNQIRNASLTLSTISADIRNHSGNIVILTDLPDNHKLVKAISVNQFENRDIPKIVVSGTPIFRVLRIRDNITKGDIAAIFHYHNS